MAYEIEKQSCYITTIICGKLNFDDNCDILNVLREFRENIIQRDCKYCDILLEYDMIGPKIADMIKGDKDTDKDVWQLIYNGYLLPTANLIMKTRYDEAILRYKRMINILKKHYGISESLDEIIGNYDIIIGEHGKVKFIERKENFNI